MKKFYLLAFIGLFMGSCTDEVLVGDIDDELFPFVESFVEEASIRGFDFDLDNLDISVSLVNIPTSGIQGQCSSVTELERHVTIDKSFWKTLDVEGDEFGKEFLIYHELGHCLLRRFHCDNEVNGICTSIMQAGTASCNDNYAPSTREVLLDELFLNIDCN